MKIVSTTLLKHVHVVSLSIVLDVRKKTYHLKEKNKTRLKMRANDIFSESHFQNSFFFQTFSSPHKLVSLNDKFKFNINNTRDLKKKKQTKNGSRKLTRALVYSSHIFQQKRNNRIEERCYIFAICWESSNEMKKRFFVVLLANFCHMIHR